MSKRMPGMSQPEMMAKWKEFVIKEFVDTGLKTKFKDNKKKNVYRDKAKSYLCALDEWHGDLEVLKYQDKTGPAEHIGTYEIECEFEKKPGQKVATLTGMKLGQFKSGKKPHQFVLL